MVGSDLAELLVQRSQSDGSWQPSAATALIDFSDGSTSEAPPLRGDDLLTGSCSNFQPSEGALQRYTQLLLAGRKKVPDSQLYIISSFAARVCVSLAIQLNFSGDIIFLFHEWSLKLALLWFNTLHCVLAGSFGGGDEQRPVGSRPLPGQQDGQQVVQQCVEQVRNRPIPQ